MTLIKRALKALAYFTLGVVGVVVAPISLVVLALCGVGVMIVESIQGDQ